MTAKEIYKIWAPDSAKWVDWVRPVPFMCIGEYSKAYVMPDLALPKVVFIEDLKETAIIVDMVGEESVRYGIALTQYGFRPIPIYNGTIEQSGARATVDNQSVGMALELWAKELLKASLDDNANPAFLLDRSRLNRYKLEDSMYDNSWDVYPQDLPSAQYFLDNGINNILVIGGRKISRDVKKILGAHQRKGLRIYHTNGYDKPRRKYIIEMPKWD